MGFIGIVSRFQWAVCIMARKNHSIRFLGAAPLILAARFSCGLNPAQADTAYGSVNNFDTVNDTGSVAHGFEIELDDVPSSSVTYTFDWNHYGTPKITEDTTSNPGHTNTVIRYQATFDSKTLTWSTYTAIPSGPIAPTQGHQFTNPSINFGGEHFGVGFSQQPTSIQYHWLLDGGGFLVRGPVVHVSTPTFSVFPAVGVAPPQVQAVIIPPPAPRVLDFGAPTWVKEIITTSHTNSEVRLRDLVTPDADFPGAKDWRNGEPDEVEVEWQLMQIDYTAPDGGGRLQVVAAPQPLNHGDEVVTRRYEFYDYVGPTDPETGEVLVDTVAPDGLHGGTNTAYANTLVVGNYLGAQMSAFAALQPLGLIDHLPDGEVGTAYPTRTVVIAGQTNFSVSTSGKLPDGLYFDAPTTQVYGTPSTDGTYRFNVEVSATNTPVIAKTYSFLVTKAGQVAPPHSSIDSVSSPINGGTTTGDGVYTNGVVATVTATPAVGFAFLNWTDNGLVISTNQTYSLTVDLNHALTANFVQVPLVVIAPVSSGNLTLSWPTNFSSFVMQEALGLNPPVWKPSTLAQSTVGANIQVQVPPSKQQSFYRLILP